MTVLIKSNQKVPKTLQGFFNRAWRWASRPEFKHSLKSAGNLPVCLYRSPDGTNACFIGACIPDKLYKPTMEDDSLFVILLRLDVKVDLGLLGGLQRCHDGTVSSPDPTKSAKNRLRAYAQKHALKIPRIK
jgi:hypothetical protein